MSIFSEMAIEARNDSRAKAWSAQAAVPAKPAGHPEPKPAEPAPAPDPAPDKPRSSESAGQLQLDRIAAMSDQDVTAFSVQRVSADTERITRRNMKDCVSEHIQALCRKNPEFARRVLHPRKTMVHCFQYIYRKAREFAVREMKELGESHENGVYALDIPDGLCYQWAEAYFNDPDAPEDQDKPKAVSKPASGVASATKKAPEKKSKAAIDGQISLLGEAV